MSNTLVTESVITDYKIQSNQSIDNQAVKWTRNLYLPTLTQGFFSFHKAMWVKLTSKCKSSAFLEFSLSAVDYQICQRDT